MSAIIQSPDPRLRAVTAPVAPEQFGSDELAGIINDMKAALDAEEDGVAIAAPQIGVGLRIFVVSKRASKSYQNDLVFINPTLVRIGKKKEAVSEGCLSVRWRYGMVKRAVTATVRAQNMDGNEFVASGRGLVAQIFQHEMDHLDGVLFIDKATDIENLPPQKAVS